MKRSILVFMLLVPIPLMAQERVRPRPQGTMVGYIDNAIISTQFRARFDAGFHTEFPDRAEFFYAKCGCYRTLAGSGLPADDQSAPGPRPGVPADLDYRQLYVLGEYAPSHRLSIFAEVPFRWLQPQSWVPETGNWESQSGLADIRAGVRLGLLAPHADRALTFQLRVDIPSGDEAQGLGTGHTSIEPGLLFHQAIGARLAVESQVSLWHPFDGSEGVATAGDSDPDGFAGDVLFFGIGPSYLLYRGERVRFGPVVELAAWRVLGGYQTVWISADRIGDEVDGTNIVNLKLGVRAYVGQRNSFYVGYGRALTDDVWYQDIVRVEYRLQPDFL